MPSAGQVRKEVFHSRLRQSNDQVHLVLLDNISNGHPLPTLFQGYDALMALGKAFRQNGLQVNKDFVNKLRSVQVQGAGQYISFDQNGDVKTGVPIVMDQVANGTLVPMMSSNKSM